MILLSFPYTDLYIPSEMSHPFHREMFLPTYILQFVNNEVDNNKPKLDHQLFLDEAATSQVLDIIHMFYPHIRFSVEAEDDILFLHNVFRKLIGPHLRTLIIPDGIKRDGHYFRALCDFPNFDTNDVYITLETGVNPHRILEFECLIICYIKNGQTGLATDNLMKFVKTYKHLNEYETSTINSAYKHTLEGLQESVSLIQNSHQEIEGIGLQLFNSEISQTHRQDLERRLESSTAKLQNRQKTFDTIVQNLGLIQALLEYHE